MTDPDTPVDVQIWSDGGSIVRSTVSDGAGDWSVDFSIPGDNPDYGDQENQPWNIEPGQNGGAYEYDDDGDATRADWQAAELPSFSVSDHNSVHGYNWPLGAPVTLAIDDPGNGPGVDYTDTKVAEEAEWDPDQTFVWFHAPEDQGIEFPIEPGFVVTMTDGTTLKTHIVTGIEVTHVDPVLEQVTGVTSPDAWIEVWVDDTEAARTVQADGSGDWVADFSVPGPQEHEWQNHDIEFDTYGGAEERDDDGDTTRVEWRYVLPSFFVWLDGAVWGSQWAQNSPVWITFDDDDNNGNGILFETVAETDGEGWFEIYVGEEHTVAPGQYVTATDGSMMKDHWVTGVTFLGADDATDTVWGTADPGATVAVEVYEPIQGRAWEHVAFNFGPGRLGVNPDSQMMDDLRLRQAAALAIDKAALVAAIPGAGYPIDSYLEAVDPAYSGAAWAQYAYDPVAASILVAEVCAEWLAGSGRDCATDPPVVVLSTNTGNTDRDILVVELQTMLGAVGIDVVIDQDPDFFSRIGVGDFEAGEWAWVHYPMDDNLRSVHTLFDPEERWMGNFYRWGTPDSLVIDADTVRYAELVQLIQDEGDPGQLATYVAEAEALLADNLVFIPLYVRAEPSEGEDHPVVTVTADGSGDWMADFSGVHDLTLGSNGSITEYDGDWDGTQTGWRIPAPPEIGVSASHDIVEGYDFGADPVTIIIDDDPNPFDDPTLYETLAEDLNPFDGTFFYPMGDEFDIEVGQWVTATNGVITKTLLVSGVAITVVDEDAETFEGVASPGGDVEIGGFNDEFGFGGEIITADGGGNWAFISPPEFDIKTGTLLVAADRDGDGDRTFFIWEIPALVEGYVLADGVPVEGAEVFLAAAIGDRQTCTDAAGYFSFSASPFGYLGDFAATGRASNDTLACSNSSIPRLHPPTSWW